MRLAFIIVLLSWFAANTANAGGRRAAREPASSAGGKRLASLVIAAMGGEARLRQIGSLHAQYSVRMVQPNGKREAGTGEMYQTVPHAPATAGRLRMDMTLDHKITTTVLTPAAAFHRIEWRTIDLSEPDAQWARRHMAGQILIPLFIVDARDHGLKLSARFGTPSVDGRGKRDVLEIQDDDGNDSKIYVDPSSHLPLELSLTPGALSTLDDYRVVDGIRVAYSIKQQLPTGATFESKAVTMTINPVLDDALFAR
jgi:hypothetical protein